MKNFINVDNRINVAVLGATGMVGQVFLSLLAKHPFFKLAVVTGKDSRNGKIYGDEVHWVLPEPLSPEIASLQMQTPDIDVLKEAGVQIVFSALPADVAQNIEPGLRENGFYVFSNAGALRYEENVPILVPEANPGSLGWIEDQGFPRGGFVVTNANCSTTGLAAALAPLRKFNMKEVFVSTYQSISGAGYPGLSSLDIMNNTIPYIQREEEKMVIELKKILNIDPGIFPHCVRVPVPFGHLETVWLTFDNPVETADILEAWNSFQFDNSGLPTMPQFPVVYNEREDFPQSRMSSWGQPAGMQVFTGRLRKQGDKIGFSLLVNNLVKGAAGGSIANAELFLKKYADKGDDA